MIAVLSTSSDFTLYMPLFHFTLSLASAGVNTLAFAASATFAGIGGNAGIEKENEGREGEKGREKGRTR